MSTGEIFFMGGLFCVAFLLIHIIYTYVETLGKKVDRTERTLHDNMTWISSELEKMKNK